MRKYINIALFALIAGMVMNCAVDNGAGPVPSAGAHTTGTSAVVKIRVDVPANTEHIEPVAIDIDNPATIVVYEFGAGSWRIMTKHYITPDGVRFANRAVNNDRIYIIHVIN